MRKKLFLLLFIQLLAISIKADNSFTLATKGEMCKTLPINVSTASNYCFSPFSSRQSAQAITGLSVDGSFTRNSKDYLVRIILKDTEGREHLVMESYKELNDEWSGRFSDYCEETHRLNHIKPDSIRIILRGASLQLTKINFIEAESVKTNSVPSINYRNDEQVRTAQVEDIVRRINSYNTIHNKLWRAGVTKLSLKSYEDKKRIMGFDDCESTGGMEYYTDGIFEMGDIEDFPLVRSESSLSFVDGFDWREQHGKNWITPNKHQGDSGYCHFFTCIACAEALTNLYYNNLLNVDLSEQELACCCGLNDPYHGVSYNLDSLKVPLEYLVSHGVCDEVAYPFTDDSLATCQSSETTPNELITISGYGKVNNTNEDSLKEALLEHGPLVSGVHYWGYNPDWSIWEKNHAMLIVGYGQLHEGDTIYRWIESNGNCNGSYTVSPHDPRIGMTYWIYKNSYGLSLDSARLGYMYYIHYNYNVSVTGTYYILPQITSMNYTDTDIVCEDSDGDGYYYWGIGNKPTWCPEWVPDVKDGDDSNFLKGKMYYDSPNIIGDLELLNPNGSPTLQINGNTTYNTRQIVFTHVRINSNSTLTVEDVLNLFGRVTITIDSGGELVIDGGVITNADIDFSTGGKLTIKNGGKLVMRTNTDFEAPSGAIVEVENGEICSSNDF